MSIKLEVLFGTEQVRKYEYGEELTEAEKETYLKQYTFETEAEKAAFLKGMDEASDWLKFLPIETEEPYKNKFQAMDVDYLRPDKTIETVVVTRENLSQVCYVYNYQGNSFRVFPYITDLLDFFNKGTEPPYHFETDEALDAFFGMMELDKKVIA